MMIMSFIVLSETKPNDLHETKANDLHLLRPGDAGPDLLLNNKHLFRHMEMLRASSSVLLVCS
jgi:hypothetical protein